MSVPSAASAAIPRIFLSHSHKDHAFTARLAADLKAAGAEVWVAEEEIAYDDFVKWINRGLAQSQWLVLVLSPDALTSEWVEMEVNAAINMVKQHRMRAVIPIVARPFDPHAIPPTWDNLHRYDATRDYPTALAGLTRALSLTPPPPPPAPPLPAGRGGWGVRTSIPPAPFPQRLADLGFTARKERDVAYILPPLCPVPAGPFLMGEDKQQHTVTLPDYQIARYPLTVAEYACFVRAGHSEPRKAPFGVDWATQLQRLDHPVTCVSWHDAVAYAAWLAQLTGQPWRLPSEAEWEKAARGTDGRLYPWGNAFDAARANTRESGKRTTTPAGTYPGGASPYGAQDMAGNVWEWTSSLFKPYHYRQNDGREDLNSTENRVLRGGSWAGDAGGARAACRDVDLPDLVLGGYGVRLVLAAPARAGSV